VRMNARENRLRMPITSSVFFVGAGKVQGMRRTRRYQAGRRVLANRQKAGTQEENPR